MKRFFRSKWFKIPFFTLTFAFAAYGFFGASVFVASYYGLTNESGAVDANNRYFQEIHDKYNQSFKIDSVQIVKNRYEALNRIIVLNDFYPKNAEYILAVLENGSDEREVLRMLDAVDLQVKNDRRYQKAVGELKAKLKSKSQRINGLSVFDWMNISEWKDFKIAVAKDKKLIDSVASVTGVEGRLIVSCLVGEQIRLFNSSREAYKKWIGKITC